MRHAKGIELVPPPGADGLVIEEYKGVTCPSSNDLRLFGLWKNGVSGSVFGLI